MLTRIVKTFWQNIAVSKPPEISAVAGAKGTLGTRVASGDVVDDQQLLELAAEPEQPLFSWLHAETSLAPLILLLAALAPAFVVQAHSFTVDDALWGEKSVECVAADRLAEFVDPSCRDREVPFRWQPPLITWFTALLQRALGPERLTGLYIVPALSAAGLIVAAVLFARIWGGTRAALATGLLIAFHPQLVQITPAAATWVAGMGLGMLGLWGFARHWNEYPKLFSWPLLISGLATGLTLLAGGPLAIGFLLVTGAYVAWWGLARRFVTVSWTVRGVSWGRRMIARSWGMVVVLAGIVGGWWVLLMITRYGTPFLASWLSGRPSTEMATTLPPFAASLYRRLTLLGSPLYLGLAFVGVLRTVADNRGRPDDAAWRHRRMLLVWGVLALLLWVSGGSALLGSRITASAWRAFLVVPLVMLAVVGLTEIADRRLPFATSFGILVATIAWGLIRGGWGTSVGMISPATSTYFLRFFALVIVVFAGWGLFQWARDSHSRQARVLTALIVGVFCAHSVAGIRGVRSLPESEGVGSGLHELRESLSSLGNVRHVTLVELETQVGPSEPLTSSEGAAGTSRAAPTLLRWIVKCHWPRATITRSTSWEQALASSAANPDDSPGVEKDTPPRNGSLAGPRTDMAHSGHLIIVWGTRGHLNVPPVPSPARRHGSTFSIAEIEAALFAVPAGR